MIIVDNNLICFIFRWLWSRQINNQRIRCICFFCLGFSIKSTKKKYPYNGSSLSQIPTFTCTNPRSHHVDKCLFQKEKLFIVTFIHILINMRYKCSPFSSYLKNISPILVNIWINSHGHCQDRCIVCFLQICLFSVFRHFPHFVRFSSFTLFSFFCVYSFKRMNIFFSFRLIQIFHFYIFTVIILIFFLNLFQHFYLFLIYSRSFCNLLSNFFGISLFLIFHTCKI